MLQPLKKNDDYNEFRQNVHNHGPCRGQKLGSKELMCTHLINAHANEQSQYRMIVIKDETISKCANKCKKRVHTVKDGILYFIKAHQSRDMNFTIFTNRKQLTAEGCTTCCTTMERNRTNAFMCCRKVICQVCKTEPITSMDDMLSHFKNEHPQAEIALRVGSKYTEKGAE